MVYNKNKNKYGSGRINRKILPLPVFFNMEWNRSCQWQLLCTISDREVSFHGYQQWLYKVRRMKSSVLSHRNPG